MDIVENWENPISDISYQNYLDDNIKSHRLAFQDKNWYDKNKNNFSDSLKNNYQNLLPSFAKKIISNDEVLPNNYLKFGPDEFIRFGYLEQISVAIPDIPPVVFWAVRIPRGLQLYHSSRSLGLNHSDFPNKGYSNQLSTAENYQNVINQCPPDKFIGKNEADVMNGNICTYISYYSTPYLTREYLTKDYAFGGSQIKYAYGINEHSYDRDYNDRERKQSDEYGYGVQAYELKEDRYFIILGLDDFLIERPDLGRENMRTFKNVIQYLSPVIKQQMNIDDNGFNNFLNLITSTTGIGSLQDNLDMLIKDEPKNAQKYINGFLNWVIYSGDTYRYNSHLANTAGHISSTSIGVNQSRQINQYNEYFYNIDFNLFRGVRFSTFEHDRPVMNMLGWLFGSYSVYNNTDTKIRVSGFTSSSMYVPTKGNNLIKYTPERKGLGYFIAENPFHSEVGMFYAPDDLERNKDNKYDLNYSINYEGIAQEFRKYKTTNIMKYVPDTINGYIPASNYIVDNFHQGHLLEHSTWVGLIGSAISDKPPYNKYLQKIPRNTYLIAGYIHDIGKSGECIKTAVYKGLDHQKPLPSVCDFVNNGKEIIGMKYYDIPDHPEKGYEYLKGYKVYHKFTLDGLKTPEEYLNKSIPTYFADWEKMFSHLDVDSYNKRLIRIVAATHWYYGDSIGKLIKNNVYNSNEIIDDFIKKIELFYNDEFYNLDYDEFRIVIIFVIALSVADIIGSEYKDDLESTGLSSDLRATLINFLPNMSQNNYYNKDYKFTFAEQLVNYALNLQQKADWKQNIVQNAINGVENFVDLVSGRLQFFRFNPNNNYSLLYNLTNSYLDISDIKRAYPSKFPKVITFDLDQTLFAINFGSNQQSTYNIYPDTYKVIEEVQKIRNQYFPNNPTYIAVTSRHYSPISLMNLLRSPYHNGKKNPLYYTNFDYIVSRYTGPFSKIRDDVSKYNNFFGNNGYPSDGFVWDINTNYYSKIPDGSPNFPDLDKMSKHGHFAVIKKRYDIRYEDILSFDDDAKYYDKTGLGPAEKVMVAGVLTSNNVIDQGIRMTLFRSGVAHYVFDKICRGN